jgi:GntR family transcriptional repressor for pyruvate dehydrogenase complex
MHMAMVRPDLSRHLTEQIVSLIERQGLAEGDRLPTMRELAQTFEVATPTIREALRRLQATGVVDIRHGSGIYVKRPDRRLVITNPHHHALDGEAIHDLLEARLLIEPQLSSMAATRMTPETLDRLAAILEEAERFLAGQDRELGPRNMEFHGEIARAAGNPLLSQFIDSLIDVYGREQLVIMALFDARADDHRHHLGIFDALRAGDAALAAERMTLHLQEVQRVIAARM